MTPDKKYSPFNRDNLTQPIQMQLSQKQKSFSEFVFAFSECKLNFEHFQKKDDPQADVFPNLRTPKNVNRYMFKKPTFRGPFDRQHDKHAITLLQSKRQNRYHIY